MHRTASNWTEEAARAAVYAAEKRRSEHHGTMPWGEPGIAAVFGNDGYRSHYASQAAVGLMRQELHALGVRVVGFGLDQDGNTWALIVETGDLEGLRELARSAWKLASETDPNDLE